VRRRGGGGGGGGGGGAGPGFCGPKWGALLGGGGVRRCQARQHCTAPHHTALSITTAAHTHATHAQHTRNTRATHTQHTCAGPSTRRRSPCLRRARSLRTARSATRRRPAGACLWTTCRWVVGRRRAACGGAGGRHALLLVHGARARRAARMHALPSPCRVFRYPVPLLTLHPPPPTHTHTNHTHTCTRAHGRQQ
jgi:hypothetical protein